MKYLKTRISIRNKIRTPKVYYTKKSFKIAKGQSEAVNRTRTDKMPYIEQEQTKQCRKQNKNRQHNAVNRTRTDKTMP